LTAIMSSKSASDMSRIGASRITPALLTTTSTPPNARSFASNMPATAFGSPTSACAASARPPADSISRTTAFAASALRS
jgi:hypothetical protein